MSLDTNIIRVNSKDKSIGGKLTNLWRKTLLDLELGDQLNGLVGMYHKRYKSSEDKDNVLNSQTLRTNAVSDSISLKSLVQLLVHLLKVKSVRFTITLTHGSGKETHHSVELLDIKEKTEDK